MPQVNIIKVDILLTIYYPELPDAELRKTLWSLVAFPKLKRQVLLVEPPNLKPTEWTENTAFWINQVSRGIPELFSIGTSRTSLW